MSLLSIPVEILYDVADSLTASDICSLILASRQLHRHLVHYLDQLAQRYKIQNPQSLSRGLHKVSFWYDKGGNGTVLEWAVVQDQLGIFRRLLEMGCSDAVQKDSYDVTLLHRLAGQGKVKFMPPVIEKLQKDQHNPFETDVSCLTPLHYAAGCGQLQAVELLITFGADVNAKDHHGNTPLHLAAVTGFSHVFETLVAAGALVNSLTYFGWTAIDQASIAHHDTAVDELQLLGSWAPRWQEKKYALHEYIRHSPCPRESFITPLDLFNALRIA